MNKTALAILAVASAALAVQGASPQYSVELFSNHTVKSITAEAINEGVRICGGEIDSPCLILGPGKKISCTAARVLDCRMESSERSFTRLRLDSTAPFRIAPTYARAEEPAKTYCLENAEFDTSNEGMRVVTRVDLESYVSGVLRGEASVLRAPAARQAMAILARTWALRWQGRHSKQGFDFCSLTHCQAFDPPQTAGKGFADNLDPAVRATRGQVLRFHGTLADPYFTACCGGVTEAAGNVWPDRAQPYLISIHDPYCSTSQHASWSRSLSESSLLQVLREALNLPNSGKLAELSVASRDSSGRALTLRVVADGSWTVDANLFRYAIDRRLGWGQIESNLYDIRREGQSWVFTGHGLGHGVGLCQSGAEQMAQLGTSAEKILVTYFPGTEIAAGNDDDPVASSEHFELIYPASQEPWVKETLETLEAWQMKLGSHATVLLPRVRVETLATTEEFMHKTGQPGWMAASSDGLSIILQPLALLARKQILNQTLRHELTHLVVHKLRAKSVPRWVEEGCVLYLTGEQVGVASDSRTSATELEAAITKPGSEAQMRVAYAQALDRVRRLTQLQGEAALWRVLTNPGTEDLRWFQQ